MLETQVLIIGAGPVGFTLALDLGRRGIRTTLIERNETSLRLPKMERCNARTMEIFRRLGIAESVRDAGLPRQAPMDVFLAPSMADPPIVHLPYPSVADAKAAIAACNDGQPLEPSQVISQYTLEPLLRTIIEALPGVTVRFGWELASFEQNDKSVTRPLGRAPGGRRRSGRGISSAAMAARAWSARSSGSGSGARVTFGRCDRPCSAATSFTIAS